MMVSTDKMWNINEGINQRMEIQMSLENMNINFMFYSNIHNTNKRPKKYQQPNEKNNMNERTKRKIS